MIGVVLRANENLFCLYLLSCLTWFIEFWMKNLVCWIFFKSCYVISMQVLVKTDLCKGYLLNCWSSCVIYVYCFGPVRNTVDFFFNLWIIFKLSFSCARIGNMVMESSGAFFWLPFYLLFFSQTKVMILMVFFLNVSRSPSVSRIRAKMLYATSKDRFRRELEGIHYEIQATDPTEMDLEVLRDRANWALRETPRGDQKKRIFLLQLVADYVHNLLLTQITYSLTIK